MYTVYQARIRPIRVQTLVAVARRRCSNEAKTRKPLKWSEMFCTRLAGNTGHKKSPFWHHRTTLSVYISGTTIEKNLLYSNTFSTCPDNMVSFGQLTAEIRWQVWGTPATFNGFRVLAALLHGTLVVRVGQTLRR